MRRLVVPGNLLIAGEYAVTEEGGLGFAVAIARHVRARWSRSKAFTVIGTSYKTEEFSNPGGGETLPDIVGGFVFESLGVKMDDVQTEIDSSPFFDSDGNKLGYGSSAAVTVALCACLLDAAEVPHAEEMLPQIAVGAHRRAQGGRGSGYDVLASIYGDTGMIYGGIEPRWRKTESPWLRSLVLIENRKSVITKNAIDAYTRWKIDDREAFSKFLHRSNATTVKIAEASNLIQALEALGEARDFGIELGFEIDVPAAAPFPEIDGIIYKALGAGDELFARFDGSGSENPSASGDFEALTSRVERIDGEGARWE